MRVKEILANKPNLSCCYCGEEVDKNAANEEWTFLNGRPFCPYCAGRALTEEDD